MFIRVLSIMNVLTSIINHHCYWILNREYNYKIKVTYQYLHGFVLIINYYSIILNGTLVLREQIL